MRVALCSSLGLGIRIESLPLGSGRLVSPLALMFEGDVASQTWVAELVPVAVLEANSVGESCSGHVVALPRNRVSVWRVGVVLGITGARPLKRWWRKILARLAPRGVLVVP